MLDFIKVNENNSFWLPPEAGQYTYGFFPKTALASERISLTDAYAAGGIFAFFKLGSGLQDISALHTKAVAMFQAEAKIKAAAKAFVWVSDDTAKWGKCYITVSSTDLVYASGSVTVGGYKLLFNSSERKLSMTCLNGVLSFGTPLSAQFYPPPVNSKNFYPLNISSVNLEKFLVNFSFTCSEDKEHMKNLCIGACFIYDKTLQAGKDIHAKPQYYHTLPLSEPKAQFNMTAALHPFKPLDTELSYFKMDKCSENLLGTGYVFSDGMGACLRTADMTYVFESSVSPDDGKPILYLAPAGKIKVMTNGMGGGVKFLHDPGSQNTLSLMCGFQGTQSLSMSKDKAYFHFVNGMPSYVLNASDGSTEFINLATAPWIAVEQSGDIKPEFYQHAPKLYEFEPDSAETRYIGYPSRELLFYNAKNSCFPLLPNTLKKTANDTQAADSDAYVRFETDAVAEMRRIVMKRIGIKPSTAGRTQRNKKLFVTSCYSYVYSETDNCLEWLGFANLGSEARENEAPSLAFTDVTGDMLTAFTSQEPFIVMADADAVLNCCSVPYQLTKSILSRILEDSFILDKTKEKLISFFENYDELYFDTEGMLEAVLNNACPGIKESEIRIIEGYCDLFHLEQGDFKFSLAPRSWKNTNPTQCKRNDTVILFKYRTGISLKELVLDPSTWSFKAAAGDVNEVRKRILAAIDDAEYEKERGKAIKMDSGYADFLECVYDKDFVGVLALDCPFVLESVPPVISDFKYDLAPGDIYAKYIKISCALAVKVSDTEYKLQSDITTQIEYRNDKDFDYAVQNAFDFNIKKITVRLNNHKVVMNRCLAALKLLYLIDSRVSLHFAGGETNSFEMLGSRQSKDGAWLYDFTPLGSTEFFSTHSAIESLKITKVSLTWAQTEKIDNLTFQLTGELRFKDLNPFDAFSYGRSGDQDGYIEFTDLQLVMNMDWEKNITTISQDARSLSFNLNNAAARANSLAARFPAKLVELVCYSDNPSKILPDKLGYTAIQAPIEQSSLSDSWCGLVWEIDLGTSGLLEMTGIKLLVLMGWSANAPSDDMLFTNGSTAYYVGMQLITADGKRFSMELSLFNALKLSFKTIEFKLNILADGTAEYSLHFRNFALRIFALSIPSGYNTLGVYANPNQKDSVRLGWYAAYGKS